LWFGLTIPISSRFISQEIFMTTITDTALAFAHQNQARFLAELKEFAAIPSVSTDPLRKEDVQRAAQWVANHLSKLNMANDQILPTKGHPVVYAENLAAGRAAPTVLIYGHYDVQPAEPLELWDTPAFTPTLRGDNLYARGISDMKGQITTSLNAIEAILNAGQLGVNLKFLFEGEEEIGSPHLDQFLRDNKDLLKSDFCLNLDSGILGENIPSITYALRGLAYFELRVYGPAHDLHSGVFGGVVHNPAQVLCELIAGMHDVHGRVTLPGFYDKVRPLNPTERAEIARLPMDEKYFLRNSGAPALFGEEGFTPAERVGARPTLEVNGLYSGFTGEGSKTVLPAYAMAKLSMRLVPDQDPEDVHHQLREYLRKFAPPTVRWELTDIVGGPASIIDLKTTGVEAMSQAMEKTWGIRPVFKREGGSIPVVAQMQELLHINSVIAGFALPDDNPHGPNEKLHLPTWYRGIDTIIHFFSFLIEDW
jgi:acetylornithine deacetylase/succinyl-diaminopimelate desuccinylase-like protein